MGDQAVVSICNDEVPAQPVSGVLWSGSVGITNANIEMISGLAGYISSKACRKVFDAALEMPKLLGSELLLLADVWPPSFISSPPTDYSIAIYFFPQKGRYEQVWDRLLRYMISNDLALKTIIKGVELLIFTSLLLPPGHHRFQGKYYLWGVFRKKKISTTHQSADQPLNLVNDVGAGEEKSRITLSEPTLQSLKRRRSDIAWEHTVLVEGEETILTCKYCNNVMRSGGITRFKKHLAGGDSKKFVTSCPDVPVEVNEEMKRILVKMTNNKLLKERAKEKLLEKYAKKSMLKGVKKANGKQIEETNKGSQRKKDSAWKHAVLVRGMENIFICKYCGKAYMSCSITILKQHLAGGDHRKQTTPCPCVPIEVKEEMKRALGRMAEKVKGKNQKEATWKHAFQVRGKEKLMICKYCSKAFKGFRIAWFQQHLAGRDPMKHMMPCPDVPVEAKEEMKRLLGKGAPMVNGTQMEEINKKFQDLDQQVPLAASTELSSQNSREPSESSRFGGQLCPTGSSQMENNMNHYAASSLQQSGSIEKLRAATVETVPHSTTMKHASDIQQTTVTPQPEEAVEDNMLHGDQEGTNSTPQFGCKNSAKSNMTAAYDEVMDSSKNTSGDKSIAQKGPYLVSACLGPIILAINDKFGDIARDCCFKSKRMCSNLVEEVCKAVQELKNIQFTHCQEHHLRTLNDAITDAEGVNMDVKWLRKQQDEIKKTLTVLKTYNHLNDALAKSQMVVESKRRILASKTADLKKLQSELNLLESLWASLVADEMFNSDFSRAISEYKSFPFESLVDGLL